MVIQSWADILVDSFTTIWNGFVGFVPELIGALIVFIIGLIVANGVGMLVNKVIRAIKLDRFLEKAGLKGFFERAGWKLNSGNFLGMLVQWFLIIVFLLAAVDILGLVGLTSFLQAILLYIPNIVIAVLIMLAAVVICNFLRGLTLGSIKGTRLQSSKFLATITWWAVLIFGFFAALIQLGVAVSIINTIITGFIAMVAIAGGIAFGLGGKEYASNLIERLQEKIEDNR